MLIIKNDGQMLATAVSMLRGRSFDNELLNQDVLTSFDNLWPIVTDLATSGQQVVELPTRLQQANQPRPEQPPPPPPRPEQQQQPARPFPRVKEMLLIKEDARLLKIALNSLQQASFVDGTRIQNALNAFNQLWPLISQLAELGGKTIRLPDRVQQNQ